ncbi:hypothetical protein HPB51_014359 [Rhipicephalus microplus]|uniref:Uncharacterized protein n=1 Tax=Rhipicephalus microplus TaxID=6941 RepID=A0A9J6EGH1_RHIMP|nr:hypothetical protein HPB51_014359 [Rhipicephalus microplus]
MHEVCDVHTRAPAPVLYYVEENPEEFENCLLHRQELTLREYAAWCEHRSSVARKMAVCFRHIIDKQMDCILGKHESTASSPVVIEETENQSHEEEDSVERYRPNVVVIGEDENDYDNRDRESESEEHEPLLVAEEPHRRDTKRRRKKVKQPDETRNRGTWSYPIHDQSYYYPRREKDTCDSYPYTKRCNMRALATDDVQTLPTVLKKLEPVFRKHHYEPPHTELHHEPTYASPSTPVSRLPVRDPLYDLLDELRIQAPDLHAQLAQAQQDRHRKSSEAQALTLELSKKKAECKQNQQRIQDAKGEQKTLSAKVSELERQLSLASHSKTTRKHSLKKSQTEQKTNQDKFVKLKQEIAWADMDSKRLAK